MGWFKVDDGLAFHRKTLEAGNAAIGLWTRAGSWLRKDGNALKGHPGVLLLTTAQTMGTTAQINALVKVELWHRCTVDGRKALRFHDWASFQPDAEELDDKRAVWAERKKRQRHHRAGDHSLCIPGYCDAIDPPADDDLWGRA